MTTHLVAPKINNILNRNPVSSILILSGVAGFCLGLSNASWQVAVETGQVLAGIVRYPVDTPNYLYHIKFFTIVNQFSALLLRLTGSEKIVSIIISGLLGMVSFQALSLLILAISKDIWVSALGALFIYFVKYDGGGVIYPIALLAHGHTTAVLGLSFIVLTIALICAKAYKPGLFCLGLAPCVHSSWGIWLFLILSLSSLFQLDSVKKVFREYYWYFIAGMSIAVASLIYQLYLMQALPVMEPGIKSQYLHSLIKYWDFHRRKFYWDYETQKIRFFHPAIIYCIYSIITGLLGLIHFKRERSVSFIFRLIVISGTLSLLAAGLTHLPPEKVPAYLLIFMPGRYVNLNNIVLAAVLLGILTCSSNRYYKTNYYIFLSFLIVPFATQSLIIRALSFCTILAWFAYLTLKGYFPAQETFLLAGKSRAGYGKAFLCLIAIFLLINLPKKDFVDEYFRHRSGFRDRTNDVFYLKVSQREGMMITTADFWLVSLKTRRPILVDPAALDGFMMVPESGDVLNNVLKKVYGIDILEPPPEKYRHCAKVPPDLHKELWERRTMEEWQDIRKEFGVTDILTADWKLSLPVIAKEGGMVLYEIPEKVVDKKG